MDTTNTLSLTNEQVKSLFMLLEPWQPMREFGARRFVIDFTAPTFNIEDFVPRSEVFINGKKVGTLIFERPAAEK